MIDTKDAPELELLMVEHWTRLIIQNYGVGHRVMGVIEAAQAHKERSAAFWGRVMARVMAKTREKAAA